MPQIDFSPKDPPRDSSVIPLAELDEELEARRLHAMLSKHPHFANLTIEQAKNLKDAFRDADLG